MFESLTIMEMQLKQHRFHLTPVRMVIMKKATTISTGKDAGKKRKPYTLLMGM
jgi:hypothetical protein